MASNYTENYNLCQWETTDQVLRREFNEDNAKVDKLLAEHNSSIFNLTNDISKKGNCKIVYGTYEGGGRTGSQNPTTLTFSGKPLFVATFATPNAGMMLMARGVETALGFIQSDYKANHVIWAENSITWYSTTNEYYQMNDSRSTYYYIALLAADE